MRDRLLLDRRLMPVVGGGRGWALATAATAVLALACAWPASVRADAAQVTVVSPGGAQQTLALGALGGSEDIVDRGFVLRSSTGESTVTVSGFSLAALLEAAGADPYGFSYLEVQQPAGGAVALSRDQALDSGAFPDGPPLVYATATGTGFLRPSAGPGDLNASDSFETPQGISIVLRKGARLGVHAEASTLKTRPGKPVHFRASVEGAGSGEQLTYSWYFDDGISAESIDATHSFTKPGSYDVIVGVTSDGDDTGASAVVTIQVGAPLAGPNRKGGGRNKSSAAPDHGAADPLEPAADSEASPGEVTKRVTAKSVQEPASGDRVVGELVSATVDAPAPTQQAAARSGHLQGEAGSGGIPAAAWGLLATLGLFGAGALIEARSLLR
jgi:hypothetical protein